MSQYDPDLQPIAIWDNTVLSPYLDNAATSFPKPGEVSDAVLQWLGTGAAAGRGSHSGSGQAAELLTQCRSRLARLLGVPDYRQIVFTQNCTDSLNQVLLGLLKRGDRVLVSTMDHNSVLRPLEWLRETVGVEMAMADFDPVTGLIRIDQFEAALKQRPTKLVVLTHASNVTGRVQSLPELIQLARQHGALILLDAAQTVGHVPLHFQSLEIDFLAAAGHKGLLGPLGTGVLAVRSGLETQLRPLRFGGTGSSSESLRQPEEMPARFESGNLNLPGIAGLSASVQWIESQGILRLHDQIDRAVQSLHDACRKLPGVTVYSSQEANAGILSFNIEGLDCHEVATILDQSFSIQCRAGLHCAPLAHQSLQTLTRGGTVRLSPGVFTTDEEIQYAIDAIGQIAASAG
ncbi:MAG: aminotransferase class V-fold PLP-dependent enzyme [Planctomycetaceae bacterium]